MTFYFFLLMAVVLGFVVLQVFCHFTYHRSPEVSSVDCEKNDTP
jgi:hypothetical protein